MSVSLLLTALLAGLAGGSHCVGMCGGMTSILSKGKPHNAQNSQDLANAASTTKTPTKKFRIIPIVPIVSALSDPRHAWLLIAQLHLGRLLTYAIAGSIVGGLGAAGIMLKPVHSVHTLLLILGNLSLIYLGLRCLGIHPFGQWRRFSPFVRLGKWIGQIPLPTSHIVRGLLWGCLPCGLVYGVLPIALISGTVWGGGLLMLAFGVGTLPSLLLTQGLVSQLGSQKTRSLGVIGAATALILLGAWGLLMLRSNTNMGWWC